MKKISICASLFILVSCAYEPADELTIYTSRQPQLIEPIVEKFSLETGIKVNFLSGNAQELMERIDVEGDNSPADIFMTVDAGVLWQAAERDIFSSTNSKILEENIPPYLRDPENKWFGLSKRSRVIAVSNSRVKKGDIKRYEDIYNRV